MFNVQEVRKDFPVLERVIYLDSAATTQTPVQVVEAITDYFLKYAGNYGRGAHRLARETTEKYEESRKIVANFLGTEPKNIIFTRNATEAINLVAYTLPWKKEDHIVTTLLEHHSNLIPWLRLKEKEGVRVSLVEPDPTGILDPNKIAEAITRDTKLVAVTHVSNVLGSIQDITEITKISHEAGAMVLVDAAQSVGHMPVNVKEIGCDFLAAAGHKGMLGPQGTGVLYLKDPYSLTPLYLGGGTVSQVTSNSYALEPPPTCFEAGTPNIPGVIGLGRGVTYVQDIGIKKIERHEKKLAEHASKLLQSIPGVEVYGPTRNRAGVVSFNVQGLDSHDVAIILDETRKICVRSGHHCAIPCIKLLKRDGTVRVSFALYNTREEVEILAEVIEQISTSLQA